MLEIDSLSRQESLHGFDRSSPQTIANRQTPRRAEWFLFLSVALCILDGAIRKWILRDTASIWKYAPYFSKDVMWVALIVFCRPLGFNEHSKTLRYFLLVGLPLCIMGALASSLTNLQSLNPIGAFLSVRSLFLLPILALLTVSRLQGLKLERLALLLGFFTLVNAALGTIQYSSPRDAPINYYALQQYQTVMFEENVRAMGTFPYITGFGTMAMVGAWSGLVLLGHGHEKKRNLVLGIAVYISAIYCALLSISRGPMIVVLALFLVWLLSAQRLLDNLVRVGAAALGLTLLLLAFDRVPVFQSAIDVMLARDEAASDTISGRALSPIGDVAACLSEAPLGVGFGSEQVGGVFAQTGIMSFRTFEGQFPRIILEAGIAGLVGFLFVFFGLLVTLYRAARAAPDPVTRRSVITGMFLIAYLMYSNVVFDHVASFFAWIIAAALLAAASDRQRHSDNRWV